MLVLTIDQVRAGAALEPGRAFRLGRSPSLAGRGESCPIWLPDSTVSREHARLTAHGLEIEVEVLPGRSSTFLNGRRLRPGESVRVPAAGAQLQLGGVLLAVKALDETVEFQERLGEADSPVTSPPLVTWSWEAGEVDVRVSGRRLDLYPAAARALAVLLEHPSESVASADIQDELGSTANVEQLMSYIRAAFRQAIQSEALPQARLATEVARVHSGASVEELATMDPRALLRILVQSRRGFGYALNLAPDAVRMEVSHG